MVEISTDNESGVWVGSFDGVHGANNVVGQLMTLFDWQLWGGEYTMHTPLWVCERGILLGLIVNHNVSKSESIANGQLLTQREFLMYARTPPPLYCIYMA